MVGWTGRTRTTGRRARLFWFILVNLLISDRSARQTVVPTLNIDQYDVPTNSNNFVDAYKQIAFVEKT